MLLIYDEHVIQQLPAGAANPAHRRSVLPWASIRGPLQFYAKILDRFCKLVGEDRIVVVDSDSAEPSRMETTHVVVESPIVPWVS